MTKEKTKIMSPVPKIGHIYHAFDDGKVTPSRHMLMKVVDVYEYDHLKPWIKACVMWEKDEHYWLFDGMTDYVVKCEWLTDYSVSNKEYYFIRTIHGGWFAMAVHSWMDGCELDTTGDIWNYLITEWRENVLSPSKEDEFNEFVKENTITEDGTKRYKLY